MDKRRVILVFAGLGAAVAAWLALHFGLQLSRPAAWCGAITMICAVWWVTEPIPIPMVSTNRICTIKRMAHRDLGVTS